MGRADKKGIEFAAGTAIQEGLLTDSKEGKESLSRGLIVLLRRQNPRVGQALGRARAN